MGDLESHSVCTHGSENGGYDTKGSHLFEGETVNFYHFFMFFPFSLASL